MSDTTASGSEVVMKVEDRRMDALIKLRMLLWDLQETTEQWRESVWRSDLDEYWCCSGKRAGLLLLRRNVALVLRRSQRTEAAAMTPTDEQITRVLADLAGIPWQRWNEHVGGLVSEGIEPPYTFAPLTDWSDLGPLVVKYRDKVTGLDPSQAQAARKAKEQ